MSKVKTTYRVTTQDQEGNFSVEENVTDPPLKGDTFEYEHREVRVGSVQKVEQIDTHHDGSTEVTTITEIGNSHHVLEAPETGDEIPRADELAADPPDPDNPPSTGNTDAGTLGAPSPSPDNG